MDIIDPTPRRTKQVNILLSEEEKKRLDAAVRDSGTTLADFVRQAINAFARQTRNRKKRSRSS